MNKRSTILYFSAIILSAVIIAFYIIDKDNMTKGKLEVTRAGSVQNDYVNVDEFGANGEDSKDDYKAIQDAINYSHDSKLGKVRLQGNKRYIITKGLVLKEGVELEFDQNTRLSIEGNFQAIVLKKNASITNGIIEINHSNFDLDVIYLDGNQKIWSADRTQIKNVTILNNSGSHKGTALHLYAGGPGHFICFVNFSDLKIAGFHTGVKLEAVKPKDDKYSFINGNRFINLTLDDCITGIDIKSSMSVPNESSGNDFSGLQIQVSKITKDAIKVSGSDNKFEGIIWDVHILKSKKEIIEFSKASTRNSLYSNIESTYIKDKGLHNYYSSPEENAKSSK
ncbi:glycosyl hydrolase family 28-related protein [Neobacillus pocheonensis]|uniref:glycosyl hydrolase family 28-related protein n=1 Tax=Neobacillus pocheonensis TaxID=363869 RepID=UPI003D282605